MSKRIFTFIMALMGLSIVGIIIVQQVWIMNAIQVKNELFVRSVVDALSESSKRVENQNMIQFYARPAINDSVQPGNYDQQGQPLTVVRGFDNQGDERFEVLPDDANRQNDRMGNRQKNFRDDPDNMRFTRKDTIQTDTESLLHASRAKLDSLNKVADSLGIMTPEIKDQIDFQKEKLNEVRNQIVSELNSFDSGLLPITEIHKIIKSELEDRRIPIDFDLALLENDTIRSMTENADSLALSTTQYKRQLFPRAFFNRNRSLAIYFPTQSEFIFKSVSWLLFTSLILSLIVLLTFGLSVLFMLKQKKISEMKSDFINNMTHEFKTPIATISVAADTIQNSKVISQPDKINYFVDMIKKENTRMNRQVEDILTIARLDKKEFEFKWEPFNIHETIEDVIKGIILQIESRGGRISTKLMATNPTITSDKKHFSSIIYNLLDNANKYSPDKPEISIETRNTINGIIISVEDHGIGMSKSVQTKIFERFYRQTSGNIHNVKGFGLGLSYTKAVVEANKGSITVHSELGKGSRFDVFLPFLRES